MQESEDTLQIYNADNKAKMFKVEGKGEPACLFLSFDELIVLGEHPDFYDSRYFGAIKIDQIIAKVIFLF